MLPVLLVACVLFGSALCSPSLTAPGVAVSAESSLLQPSRRTQRGVEPAVLAEVAKALASIETSVAAIYDSQLKYQTESSSRLDTVEKIQSNLFRALSARLETFEASQGALSSRIDTVLQQQSADASRTAAINEQLNRNQAAVSRMPWTVLGKTCSSDTDCSNSSFLPGVKCGSNGLCSCRDGYRHVFSDTVCRQNSRLDELCLEDADCQGKTCSSDTDCSSFSWLQETKCGSNSLCSCLDGYRRVSDTVCTKNARLDEPCQEDADCQTLTKHAICRRGACDCPALFWKDHNNGCRPVATASLGDPCAGDLDCSSFGRCISNICQCRASRRGNYEYRLRGGSTCIEGRVELRQVGGAWGLVCDDYWDDDDATVVCRSLGFRFGDGTLGSQFGNGTNFYMDDVRCGGLELHLTSCRYRGWGKHDCGSAEVAGVSCSP